MSSSQEAANRRREKLLAKSAERMKFVTGERKVLDEQQPEVVDGTVAPVEAKVAGTSAEPAVLESDQAKTVEAVHVATEEPKPVTPHKAKWELKWERDLSVVSGPVDISEDTLKSLEVTAQMAVEAPRAQKTLTARSTPVTNRRKSPFSQVKLDSILITVIVIFLGIMSGMTGGTYIVDNLWLPFGSFLFFALLLRVVLTASFSRLGLSKSKAASSSGSSGLIQTALNFIPPPFSSIINQVMAVSGYFKDSYDDMMLFVFAHGLASRLAVTQRA